MCIGPAVKPCFLSVCHPVCILQFFCLLFQRILLSPEGKEFMQASHLGLSAPRSLTLCPLSSCVSQYVSSQVCHLSAAVKTGQQKGQLSVSVGNWDSDKEERDCGHPTSHHSSRASPGRGKILPGCGELSQSTVWGWSTRGGRET